MIVQANKSLDTSKNPHSLGVQGNVEIPDSGNPLVRLQKWSLTHGIQGLAGLGCGCGGGASLGLIALLGLAFWLHMKRHE